MAQKDIGNKKPLHELKNTEEVMKFYDEWGDNDKYNKDMNDWNYSGPKETCLLYTSPSPRDRQKSRMPSSA